MDLMMNQEQNTNLSSILEKSFKIKDSTIYNVLIYILRFKFQKPKVILKEEKITRVRKIGWIGSTSGLNLDWRNVARPDKILSIYFEKPERY